VVKKNAIETLKMLRVERTQVSGWSSK